MIKDSPIVDDVRRIRNKISEKFDHDRDRYIAYLQSETASRQVKKVAQHSKSSENRSVDIDHHEQTSKETRTD